MAEAANLLIFAVVIHLVCDWLLQNEWMATNKMKRQTYLHYDSHGFEVMKEGSWWDRHPAAYVHSGIHVLGLLLIFPWWAALLAGISHLVIDTRKPVEWWSKLIKQTQPRSWTRRKDEPSITIGGVIDARIPEVSINPSIMDVGMDVRIWNDQVWHILILALIALAIS